ncbi:MAG: hypothetical protein ACODAE_07955 [Gemmatimonadota bacterium]
MVATTVIPGGAAGAHRIDGDLDASGDTLISVRHVSDDLETNDDLTGEFSVTGHNEITNDTTDTSGDFLVVTYAKAEDA